MNLLITKIVSLDFEKRQNVKVICNVIKSDLSICKVILDNVSELDESGSERGNDLVLLPMITIDK